jgi:hypothetical protein
MLACVRRVLNCLTCNIVFEEKEEEDFFDNCHKSFIIARNIYKESQIEKLPVEILWIISTYLEPNDVVHFLSVSKTLATKMDNSFWEMYLKVRNRKRWDNFTSAIEVAFAFSFFEKGKIDKAAKLGFPTAVSILKKRKVEGEQIAKERGYNSYSYIFQRERQQFIHDLALTNGEVSSQYIELLDES